MQLQPSLTETPDASLDGERKMVTALFADIKGSTELEQDLDPEEARAIVDPALNLMIDAVEHYSGYVVQSTGDGIFALFGAPIAHEDHPQRALYAALRMQNEIRRYADRLRTEGRTPLQIRVGANTGEVVVRSIRTSEGKSELSPIGHSTNLASRMQALANPGSTVIAESTRRLVDGYFDLKPLGPTKVRGISESVNVYEVVGLGLLRTRLQRSAGRGLTKFVGRQREMDAIRHAAEQARAGHGQIVAVVGEPGVGKSRLVFEFKAASQSGSMVLETFSVSHGKASAYLPVIDLLHGYFKITSEDDPRTRREKVNGKVLTLDRTLEDTIPHVFTLLGLIEVDDALARMDAQIRKQRTLEAIKRILLRESLNQPLIMIFEDLHWIDEETQAFLNLLADSIGTARLLLLVNYRQEYRHGWGHKTYYTQLRLDPLGKESADELLKSRLGDGAELAPLKRLIIEKTEGNPLFMEETVDLLLEDGTLVRNGSIKLVRPLTELKIPPTVQDILAERIDRLPTEQKELLQTLAAIGREFPLGLVRGVVDKPEDKLEGMLRDLQLAEFIYEQPATGDVEYIFKHALTQDVAYKSLLVERRKQLHEKIGAAIEVLFEQSIDDHLNQLARHFGHSSNAEKAVEYLDRAARQALSRSAFNEAKANARSALAMIPALAPTAARERREFDLLYTLVTAAPAVEGYHLSQHTQSYARMLDLARRFGDDHAVLTALQCVCLDHQVAARHAEEVEVARQMMEVATRIGSPAAFADAHHSRGTSLFWTGRAADAVIELNRAIALCPDGVGRITNDGGEPLVVTLSWNSLCTWMAGYPRRAIDLSESAMERARSLRQPYSMAWPLWCAAYVRSWRGEVLQTERLCEMLAALAEENGFPAWLSLCRVVRGLVVSVKGEHDRAIELIRRGVAEWTNPLVFTYLSSNLAEACMRAGRYQEAMDAVAAGREHAKRTGERHGEAEIERLAGETLLLMNPENATEAEQCMRRAIAIASEQGAKSWELRATVSLARLLATEGKRDEARAKLTEIYNWFTEGFDSADLKEAKALLDELSYLN